MSSGKPGRRPVDRRAAADSVGAGPHGRRRRPADTRPSTRGDESRDRSPSPPAPAAPPEVRELIALHDRGRIPGARCSAARAAWAPRPCSPPAAPRVPGAPAPRRRRPRARRPPRPARRRPRTSRPRRRPSPGPTGRCTSTTTTRRPRPTRPWSSSRSRRASTPPTARTSTATTPTTARSGQLANGQDIGKDIVVFTDWMAGAHGPDGLHPGARQGRDPQREEPAAVAAERRLRPRPGAHLAWQVILAGLAWNKEAVPGGLRTRPTCGSPSSRAGSRCSTRCATRSG